jgi:hypothetical protein
MLLPHEGERGPHRRVTTSSPRGQFAPRRVTSDTYVDRDGEVSVDGGSNYLAKAVVDDLERGQIGKGVVDATSPPGQDRSVLEDQ